MSVLGPRSILLWIGCCALGLFLAPAFLSTIFASDGPFDDLMGLTDADSCRYTQHIVRQGNHPSRYLDSEIPSGNVLVGWSRRWISSAHAVAPLTTRYAPIITTYNISSGIAPVENLGVWPERARVNAAFARAELSVADFHASLTVPDGTQIRYASTLTSPPDSDIGQLANQLASGEVRMQYFPDANAAFSPIVDESDYYAPAIGLTLSHSDQTIIPEVYRSAHQLTIAYVVDASGARVPLALAAGDEQRVRQLMLDNGRNPDQCDASNGTLDQVRHINATATTADDYEYGIVAVSAVRTTPLATSVFRPVIAAAIALVPLFVVISVLAFWLPRLRRIN